MPGFDPSHIAPGYPGLRPRHELHRKAQRPSGRGLDPGIQRFEALEERRPAIPAERIPALDYHVTAQRRSRERVERGEIKRRREGLDLGAGARESVLRIADQVHLVDERNRLADA